MLLNNILILIGLRQDFINDLFCCSQGLLKVDYVAEKWKFKELFHPNLHSSGGREDSGKTELNKIIKRLYLISGGRVNYISRKHQLMGMQHALKSKDKANVNIYKNQYNIVSKLPNNSSLRKIMEPSSYLYEVLQIVDSFKPNCVQYDEEGNVKIQKGNNKCTLYDMDKLRNEYISTLINYLQFSDYKDKILEIIENYPVTSDNQ